MTNQNEDFIDRYKLALLSIVLLVVSVLPNAHATDSQDWHGNPGSFSNTDSNLFSSEGSLDSDSGIIYSEAENDNSFTSNDQVYTSDIPTDDGQSRLITSFRYERLSAITKKPEFLGKIVDNIEYWHSVDTGEIVFVDIGSEQGVQVNTRYAVYNQNQQLHVEYENQSIMHPLINSQGVIKEDLVRGTLSAEARKYDRGRWHHRGNVLEAITDEQYQKVGEFIQPVGYIQVIEVGEKISKAKVVRVFDNFGQGSLIAEFPPQVPPVTSTSYQGAGKNISAFIVATDNGYSIAGKSDIVFIDRGRMQNVSHGDRFSIYISPKEKKAGYNRIMPEETNYLLPHVIGELAIVKVNENTSAGIIVKSEMPILIGHPVVSKGALTK